MVDKKLPKPYDKNKNNCMVVKFLFQGKFLCRSNMMFVCLCVFFPKMFLFVLTPAGDPNPTGLYLQRPTNPTGLTCIKPN